MQCCRGQAAGSSIQCVSYKRATWAAANDPVNCSRPAFHLSVPRQLSHNEKIMCSSWLAAIGKNTSMAYLMNLSMNERKFSEVLSQTTTSNSQTDWNVNLVSQLWDTGRSQWPRDVRSRSVAASLLRQWVRIPPRAWMSVCCECCVLSSGGTCDELITRPEESYRLWCVVVCDLETSWMRRPWPVGGCCAKNKQTYGGESNLINEFDTAIGVLSLQISWMNNRCLKKILDIWRSVKAIRL